MRALRFGAVGLAFLALTACERDGDGPFVNSALCADFTAPHPNTAAVADAASPVDDCVRRWSYSLAGVRDTADLVANASVAACGGALTRWNEAALDQPAPQDSSGAPVAGPVNIATGQPTNAMAEHTAFAQRQALLYVIEARAGHCKPPPAAKGAPVGA